MRSRPPFLFCFLLLSAPAAAQQPSASCAEGLQPFLVAPSRIYRSAHTLAVVPVSSEQAWSAEVAARVPTFDSLLVRALRSGGFSLISATATDSAWQEALEAVGADSAQDRFRSLLGERYGVDGIVFPALVVKDAESTSLTTVGWDGTRQTYRSTGAAATEVALDVVVTSLLEGLLGTPDEEEPDDPVVLTGAALSLQVHLEDLAGRALYDGWGGVQLIQLMRGGKLVPVPDSLLLVSRRRNAHAVRTALCPLLKWKPAS